MLEVLLYLFDNYQFSSGTENEASHELAQETLAAELMGAGFPSAEIDKAFKWLEELVGCTDQDNWQLGDEPAATSIRIYTAAEQRFLKIQGQALLTRLLSSRVLNPLTHEMVIDRALALNSKRIGLEHLKWVVLMVIGNQPGFDDIAEWAEVIVSGESVPLIH